MGAAEPKSGFHHGIRTRLGGWKARVRRDLGLSEPSEAQRTVLEAAAHTWLMLRQLDAELEQPGIMTAEVRRERQRVAWLLTQQLALLGRERGPLARRRIVSPP